MPPIRMATVVNTAKRALLPSRVRWAAVYPRSGVLLIGVVSSARGRWGGGRGGRSLRHGREDVHRQHHGAGEVEQATQEPEQIERLELLHDVDEVGVLEL